MPPLAEELVDREKIVQVLLGHAREGKSALLIGAPGIGKTAILDAVADRLRQASHLCSPIYCEQAPTLKALLQAIAAELRAENERVPGRPVTRGSLGALSVGKLRWLVEAQLRPGQHILLIDHLRPVRGAYAIFLERLADERKVPIIAAVRSLDPCEAGRLWWIAWSFSKIEVPALRPSESCLVIKRTLDRAGISLPDQEEFIKNVSRVAKGNPRMMIRLCQLAQSPRYQIGGQTDLRLLLLDLKVRDLQERIDAESHIPLRGPVTLAGGKIGDQE